MKEQNIHNIRVIEQNTFLNNRDLENPGIISTPPPNEISVIHTHTEMSSLQVTPGNFSEAN